MLRLPPAPDFVEQVLQPAGDVVARHARPARLDGVGDLGDGAEVQLPDLAANVGFGERKALADDPPVLLLVRMDVDAQLARSTPRFWAQLNTAASRASAPITEQWIFCCGKPAQVVYDVLVA